MIRILRDAAKLKQLSSTADLKHKAGQIPLGSYEAAVYQSIPIISNTYNKPPVISFLFHKQFSYETGRGKV